MPRLRVLARTGVGVDLVDLSATARGSRSSSHQAAAPSRGRGSARARAAPGEAPWEMTDLVRHGRWADRGQVRIGDLDGATMGVIGYGRIGRRVGELATAFGMSVLAYDPFSPPPEDVPVRSRCARLRSDVLTLHVPLTDTTNHLVDKAFLEHVAVGSGPGQLRPWRAARSRRHPRRARIRSARRRPRCIRPGTTRASRAVRPPERGSHSASDGSHQAGHGSNVHRRRARSR